MTLEANGITVRLGRSRVLRDVAFSAAPGAVTAIVGPNGSGKTTLLRALTGEVPHEGTVRLNGRDTAEAAPWQLARQRAVLPQATTLAFPFNVIEVVSLGLQEAGAWQVARQALVRVGLSGYEVRYYQELSGGEQQRVQLARALAQVWQPVGEAGPRWLCLDEPVASLDIGHQLQVMRIARSFAEAGGGIVAVMHDLNLTAMFADRVVLLEGGRVLGEGAPEAVLTDALLSRAYNWPVRVGVAPAAVPFVLPQAAGDGRAD